MRHALTYRLVGACFGAGIVVLATMLSAPFPNVEAGVIIIPFGIRTQASTFSITAAGAASFDGTLDVGGAATLDDTLSVVGVADLKTHITNSDTGESVVINDSEGLRLTAKALPTCDASLEWAQQADVNSGGTTTARSRLCMCTSDGAAVPAYAWQNVVSGTVGTNTVCDP